MGTRGVLNREEDLELDWSDGKKQKLGGQSGVW